MTENRMELFIETLTGTAFELSCSPLETIVSIKAKIQFSEGIPVSQQHLIWKSQELNDDLCLQDYSITDGATLKLVLGMRGGPINTRQVSDPKKLKELAEYVERSSEAGSSGGRPLTVLLFHDGDKVHVYTLAERGDCTVSRLSGTISETSSIASMKHIEELDQERSKENEITRDKIAELQEQLKVLSINRARSKKDSASTAKCSSVRRTQVSKNSNSFHLPPLERIDAFDSKPNQSSLKDAQLSQSSLPFYSLDLDSKKTSVGQGTFDRTVRRPSKRPDQDSHAALSLIQNRDPNCILPPQEKSSLELKSSSNVLPYIESGTVLPSSVKDNVPSDRKTSVGQETFDKTIRRPPKRTNKISHAALNLSSSPEKSSLELKGSSNLLPYIASTLPSSVKDTLPSDIKTSVSQEDAFDKTISHPPKYSDEVSHAALNLIPNSVPNCILSSPEKSSLEMESNSNFLPYLVSGTTLPSSVKDALPSVSSQQTHFVAFNTSRCSSQDSIIKYGFSKANKTHKRISLTSDETVSSQKLIDLDSWLQNRPKTTPEKSSRRNYDKRLPFQSKAMHAMRKFKNSIKIPVFVGMSSDGKPNMLMLSDHGWVSCDIRSPAVGKVANPGIIDTHGITSLVASSIRAFKENSSDPTTKESKGSLTITKNPKSNEDIKRPNSVKKLPLIKAKQKSYKRCTACSKKTGLATSYTCRCGKNFCASHRYAETHHCTYDYKTEGRRLLQLNNPVVTASKLPKI